MDTHRALVIGGTGFLGRHVIDNLLQREYSVVSLSRNPPHVPIKHPRLIDYVTGDRNNECKLNRIAKKFKPSIVIDCAVFHPDDAATAVRAFAEVNSYVLVSSGGVYKSPHVPKREEATPLHGYSKELHDNDDRQSYPARKAECDRIVRGATHNDCRMMVVRPCLLYGPESPQLANTASSGAVPSRVEDMAVNQTLHDYWIDRVNSHDAILMPGDGNAIWHRAYVEDVAEALRIVAEKGEAGEAYNMGDSAVCTIEDVVEQIAEVLQTEIDFVHVDPRDLSEFDLAPSEFPLFPAGGYPHILDTCKIRKVGYESTPPKEAIEKTVQDRLGYLAENPIESPDRDIEEQLIKRA